MRTVLGDWKEEVQKCKLARRHYEIQIARKYFEMLRLNAMLEQINRVRRGALRRIVERAALKKWFEVVTWQIWKSKHRIFNKLRR